MSRISRAQMWMDMAHVAAKRGGCYRGNVGALLVRDNNVLSVGYNGPPPGDTPCMGGGCPVGANGGCVRSWHAEMNAIRRCEVVPDGADMYATVSPCTDCAEAIVGAVIHRVFFAAEYRSAAGLTHLISRNVQCFRVTPAGHVINHRTKELIEQ